MKVKGTVRWEDGGAGRYLLFIADDGARYLLGGATKALRPLDGGRVELEGEVDPTGVSLAMTGDPVFRVTRSSAL